MSVAPGSPEVRQALGQVRQESARPARRRNSTHYAGDLRRDLLDEALRAVESDGPSSVTLRAVARRLGVSHAAPANHFPDKTALFTAIAVDGFALLEEAMARAVTALPDSADAVTRLRTAGTAYMHFALAHRAHFEVMWRNDLLHNHDPSLVAAGGATLHQLVGAVQAAQAEGWAADADPQAVTYLAWSVVHGLATLWLNGPIREHDDRPFEHVADTVSDLLTAALSPTGSAGRPAPRG